MYKQNNRNNFSNKSGSKFKYRFKRSVKRLDPNLFIRKAEEVKEEIDDKALENNLIQERFDTYEIVEKLKRNIKDHGYEIPTEIQVKAIPEILAGKDVVAMAKTGTGKTAAFLISLINKSFLDRNQRVLIVVPTRELAIQIRDEYRIFAKGTELEVVALVGGASIKQQYYSLKHRPHFVIGTPGRLKDLVDRKQLNLSQFQNVVLDEVDKMVDIGFIHDIKYLMSFLPKVRQSLFFSATISSKTQDILRNFVTNPVTISVEQKTVNNIDQNIIKLTNGESKIDKLHDLLTTPGFDKVIIFGRTKWGVQRLSQELATRGFKVQAIHGNKNQNQRQKALSQFKNNEIQILLATDVASRGIDVENITHVINYDAPESFDDYIHRIGRTGRAGKKGIALTFV